MSSGISGVSRHQLLKYVAMEKRLENANGNIEGVDTKERISFAEIRQAKERLSNMDSEQLSSLKSRVMNSINLGSFKGKVHILFPDRFKLSKKGFVRSMGLMNTLNEAQKEIKKENVILIPGRIEGDRYYFSKLEEALEDHIWKIVDYRRANVPEGKLRDTFNNLLNRAEALVTAEEKAINEFNKVRPDIWQDASDVFQDAEKAVNTLDTLANKRKNLKKDIRNFRKQFRSYQDATRKDDLSAKKDQLQEYQNDLSQMQDKFLAKQKELQQMREGVSKLPIDFAASKERCKELRNKFQSLYRGGVSYERRCEAANYMQQCNEILMLIRTTESNLKFIQGDRVTQAMEMNIDEKAVQAACETIQEECDAINVNEDCKDPEKYSAAEEHYENAKRAYNEVSSKHNEVNQTYWDAKKAYDQLEGSKTAIEDLSGAIDRMKQRYNNAYDDSYEIELPELPSWLKYDAME